MPNNNERNNRKRPQNSANRNNQPKRRPVNRQGNNGTQNRSGSSSSQNRPANRPKSSSPQNRPTNRQGNNGPQNRLGDNQKLQPVKSGKNKSKKRKEHSKLKTAIKIIIIIFLLLCVVGAGIVAGVFFGLFGDEFEITKDELKIGASNSVIVDENGGVIANLSGDEKRKIITLADMADYLPKAYVAIEDERYYKHSGVDFKRTAGAIVNTVFGGGSSYGGSTITQQLVKNITKDDEASGMAGILRKVKEWAKAYQVERMISKDQILELYLNILFVGSGNLHGVELGAEYYFNKSAKDLDLAECAFMAGINSSPNAYDPFDETKDNGEKIKKKTITVLNKMKELGYIQNEEEYNAAVQKVEAGLPFSKGANNATNHSYHTDAVIDQVVTQVMDEKDISRQLAENYVYSSGLTIYSTVNAGIQARLDEEYAKSKYVIKSPSKKQTSQSGMAIVDYKTGKVLAVAGGFGEKTASGWNRATQMKKQTGSSMKPISAVAPGLEEKVITAATVYDDVKTDFGGYTPKNYNHFRGLITIRQFIETSQNIPAVKIMKELTPKKSVEYLEKMGITSLVEKDKEALSIALGGVTEGVSPLEMAVAYGTIANDGVRISPTFFTKVVDSSGNTVLTPKQETVRALSEQNAYIAKTIIKEPVIGASGTARHCAISGMDVAAKTGTTNNDYDRWLCGFTPYYTAATWFGYDDSEEVFFSGGNPALLIWSAVMSDIHKDLPRVTFNRPSGIVDATVCRTTGCLATNNCANTYKEIFTQDNMPGRCEGHGSQQLCAESGLLATEYCPTKKLSNYGAAVPKEKLNLWKTIGASSVYGKKITDVCNIHKKPEEKPKENTVNKTPTNTTAINTQNTTNKTPANTTTNTTKPATNTTPNTQTKPNTKPSTNPTTNTGATKKPNT